MDNYKDDAYYSDKIRSDIMFIVEHTKGIEKTDLRNNEILLDSMMFRLIQISENAKKMSEEYKVSHDVIPWNNISGLRNKIVHDYGNVNVDIIYFTVKDDIPELLIYLEDNNDTRDEK